MTRRDTTRPKRKHSGSRKKETGNHSQKQRRSSKKAVAKKKISSFLKLPTWALNEILDYSESREAPWPSTASLGQLSKAWQPDVVLRDGRALAEDENLFDIYGKNKESVRVIDIAQGEACCMQTAKLLPTTRLLGLRLENGQVRGSLFPFGFAFNLTYLSLAGCDDIVSDLKPIEHLQELRVLNLHGCHRIVGSLEPLERLVHLKHLKLSYCWKLKGSIEPLSKLKALNTLYLDWCEQLQGNLFITFGQDPLYNDTIPQINQPPRRFLHLLDPAPPKHGPPLRHISILNTSISGATSFRRYHPRCTLLD